MEIKLSLRMQTLLNLAHFLEHLELETGVLLVVAGLLVPFVIYSLWSLSVAVICQLFWLGVKAGVLLFGVCSAYIGFLKISNATTPVPGGLKCTLMDVILSVLFQTGMRIPAVIWDRLAATVSGGGSGVGGNANNAAMRNNMQKKNKNTRRSKSNNREEMETAEEDVRDAATAGSGLEGSAVKEASSEEEERFADMDFDMWGSGDFNYEPAATTDAKIISDLVLSSNPAAAAERQGCGGITTAGTRRRTRGGAAAGGNRKSSRNKK